MNCWGTEVDAKDGLPAAESATCGLKVPPAAWMPGIQGSLGGGPKRQTILFLFTRRDAARVRLLVATRQGDRVDEVWRRLQVRTVSAPTARKAGLRPNFGYASTVQPGQACIKRVVLIGRGNEVLDRSRTLPCH